MVETRPGGNAQIILEFDHVEEMRSRFEALPR